MDHYKKIDKAIKSYEECKPIHQYSIEWICDRIDWCWKWHKITETQMEELADRICAIIKRGLS